MLPNRQESLQKTSASSAFSPKRSDTISRDISRRNFLGSCAATAALACAAPVLTYAASSRGAAQRVFPLNRNWRFGGKFSPAALAPEFDDRGFAAVTLPHCVTPLSWQGWNPDSWQDVWIYRRHFSVPALRPRHGRSRPCRQRTQP